MEKRTRDRRASPFHMLIESSISPSGTIVGEGNTIAHENSSHSEEDIGLSKTEVKKRMLALQALGEAIVKLSPGQLATIPLDEKLKEAVDAARRIKSHEGRRRQMQYIGKLMRNSDTETIKNAYQELLDGRTEKTRGFHALEQLRDQMIEQGPNAVETVMEKYPQADRQRLRQLIMNSRKEKELDKPPASSRKLFRYIRELDES